MSDPVLKGVRVLEIGGGIPVAFAARWLAGFGADVERLDPAEESLTTDEQVYLLAGKRRVAPTSDPRALALAADIVIEGDNPGDIVKHLRRVQPEALRARKPGLVVVSITPFGQDGPYAGFEASNITSFAMGGIMSLTGMPQREPLVTGGSQALYLGMETPGDVGGTFPAVRLRRPGLRWPGQSRCTGCGSCPLQPSWCRLASP